MRPKLSASKILFAVITLFAFAACKNVLEVPFPKGETEFPQPVSRPIKFSEPQQIKWSDTGRTINSSVKKFDFDKLPVSIFDSTGFSPFPKKPEEVQFNWDNLPDTVFNYNNLPSIPLKFVTSLLEQPKIIKAGRPYSKSGSFDLIFELGEPQGLIGNHITYLFEDRSGFMWIATDQGLYRYDGEYLVLYISGQLNIICMLEDNKGQIWTNSFTELTVIDTKNGIIKRLANPQDIKSNGIVRMQSDSEGRIWVTSFDNGVHIVDENTHVIKHLDRPQGILNKSTIGMTMDNNKNIWIGTLGGGINIIDLKKGKIKYLNKANGLSTDSVVGMICDNSNRIISTFNGDMSIIEPEKRKITHYDEQQGLMKKIVTYPLLDDNKGNIWIGTGIFGNKGIGIEIINPAKGLLKKLNTSTGLTSDNIQNILRDSRGQIWIATANGLNMLNKNGNNIEHLGKKETVTLAEDVHGQIWVGILNSNSGVEIFDPETGLARILSSAHGLKNDTVQNMYIENSKIWIGTNGGIDIIDSSRKTIQHLGKSEGLKSDNESIMMKDKDGRMWLGSIFSEAIADVLDLENKTIRTINLADHGFKDTTITDIKQDKQGQIWLSTFTGRIYVIDPGKNIIKYINNVPGINDRSSKVLLPDEQGNMWVGTSKGIYILNSKGDSMASLSTREGLINENVVSLNKHNGNIYAGTSGGVSIITVPTSLQKNWQVRSFGKAQGIIKIVNTYASDIITKKGQFLWGDKGLTVLSSPEADTSNSKTYITGFDIFNQPQYFANKPWSRLNEKDTLWSSKKDTFYLNGQMPANTSFSEQAKMQWDSITEPYKMPVNLSLPYYQNYLQFHFIQTSLGGEDTIWYRYILQGVDKKWSDRTYNTYSQNYLNLPPGDYQFKVSSISKGKWSEPAVFEFTITPPWWKTWWAYGLYILVFSGLVWAFAQYRSRKLKRENLRLEYKITQRTNQLKQSLDELKATQAQLIQSEKMASLGELTAGIAHEIQNPLNFVNNFSEVNSELIAEMKQEIDKGNYDEVKTIAHDIDENEQKIIFHGKRADAIVKGMLQHSRSSSGVKEPTDINALADEYLRLAYHGLRAKDKSFNAAFETDFDPSIGKVNVITQDIGRVILNLITNAFYAVTEKKKQQPDGYEPTVSVSTKKTGDKILISVKDNGNGIPQKVLDKIFQPFFTTKPAGQGTGLGLSLSYDIVTKGHGGELKVKTKEGEYTEFVIVIPV